MDASGQPTGQRGGGETSGHLRSALDELRAAAESASEDVRARVNRAYEMVLGTGREGTEGLSRQVESLRASIQGASDDALAEAEATLRELEQEIERRRAASRAGAA